MLLRLGFRSTFQTAKSSLPQPSSSPRRCLAAPTLPLRACAVTTLRSPLRSSCTFLLCAACVTATLDARCLIPFYPFSLHCSHFSQVEFRFGCAGSTLEAVGGCSIRQVAQRSRPCLGLDLTHIPHPRVRANHTFSYGLTHSNALPVSLECCSHRPNPRPKSGWLPLARTQPCRAALFDAHGVSSSGEWGPSSLPHNRFCKVPCGYPTNHVWATTPHGHT